MCIVFCYTNPDPSPGKFKLIIIMNRDEYYIRPTSFVDWNDGILCGRDQEPGKTGGTWLGIDEDGRVGFLTNMFVGKRSCNKGRGLLIIDYLKGAQSSEEYLEELALSNEKYNPFNLVLCEMEEKNGAYKKSYYCRGVEGHVLQDEGPYSVEPSFIGISNHPLSQPFRKTSETLKTFRSTVEALNDIERKEELIESLVDALRCKKRLCPDPQIEKQGSNIVSEEYLKIISSTFIESPNSPYGTRCQTLILVDYDGNVNYVEKSLNMKDRSWSEVRKEFTIT